ncbi:MAG: hypothetical protein ACSW8F_02775 [bacterium]
MTIVAAALTGAVIFALLASERGQSFDERQLYYRGRAFAYGFFGSVGWAVFYFLAALGAEEPLLPDGMAVFTGALVGVGVMASYAIWHDCYLSFRQKPWLNLALLGAQGALYGWIGLDALRRGAWREKGWMLLYPMLAALFLLLFAVLLAKLLLARRERDE